MKYAQSRCWRTWLRAPGAFLLIVPLLMAHWANAAKSASSTEDLRRLVAMPKLNFATAAGVDSDGRIRWQHLRPDADELAAARRAVEQHPADPAAHLRLGRRLDEFNQGRAARGAYTQAVARFRTRVESQPEDGRLLAQLGEALWGAGQRAEAEAVLRRAVRLAPEEAGSWMILGRLLNGSTLNQLWSEDRRSDAPADVEGLLALITQRKPTGAQFDAARQRHAEALECFDGAATLAPQCAEVFERRAGCRINGALLRVLQENAAAAQPDENALYAALVTPDCLADLRRVTELEPDNVPLLSAVALYEGMAEFMNPNLKRRPESRPNGSLMKSLSPATARSIRAKMDRLQERAESSGASAAAAAELLGLLHIMLTQDAPSAERCFRRAVTVDPNREMSWDGWLAVLAREDKYQELRAVSERCLARRDTAKNRVILAKAHAALGQWVPALEQSRTAVTRDAKSFLAHFAVTVALLRTGTDERTWLEAGMHLKQALDAIAQANRPQRIQLRFTHGVLLALAGQVPEARRAFAEVLQAEPGHQPAKAAAAIVETW